MDTSSPLSSRSRASGRESDGLGPTIRVMGPIALFDKSAVEMMSADEAAIFDCLYMTNVCPIYLVEVLADLQKVETSGRTHSKVVADMARKTPVMNPYPNAHHSALCLRELLGWPIEMRRVPALGGARPVRMMGRSASSMKRAQNPKRSLVGKEESSLMSSNSLLDSRREAAGAHAAIPVR